MYCIERRDEDSNWKRDLCFKTEFKAVVNARTKSMATLGTYRVIHQAWPNQVVVEIDGLQLSRKTNKC